MKKLITEYQNVKNKENFMKMNWEKYLNFEMNVSLYENYGVVTSDSSDNPFYEVSYKAGTLIEANDFGLIIQSFYKDRKIDSVIPYSAIKCIDFIYPAKVN